MNKFTRTLFMAMAVVTPLAVFGQFEDGSSMERKPAWEQFKLPSKNVSLNFRNANVDLVLDFYMRISGITIIKDPALKEPMTVSSPKPISVKQAFEILFAALGLRGYQMEKQGSLIVVKPKREEGNRMTPEQMAEMMNRGNSRGELQVYQITFAAASEVARVINEVFAMEQSGDNDFRGRFGGGDWRSSRARGGWGGGGSSQQSNVRASADDFSNSVIVYAPRDKHEQVEELIESIDKQTEAPQTTKVYPLEYTDAESIVPVIQNVLTSMAPTGRGANAGSNVSMRDRFRMGFSSGNFQSAFGTVVADPYTNSIVVTAIESNHAVVEKVLKDLDKDVEVQRTTFVIPLDNARADAISDLLNDAFGNGTGSSGRNNGNNNNRGQNNRNNNRNNNRGGNNDNRLGRGIPEDDLSDGYLNLDVGNGEELYTDIYAAQGQFRFGGFQRSNNQQNDGPTRQRGADGRLVNVLDLDGQVSVIPDPNTNSLIIVTSPENMQLIRDILAQLDRVPEQVMIETLIVEATLDKSMKLGVEWNFVNENILGNNTGTGVVDFGVGTANPQPQGFRYTLSGNNFSAFLNALQTDDKFQVLSTPRIFTSNNVEAEINISQSVPYVLSTREDSNGNLTFNYAFQDVGIVLTVLPQISANGKVTLEVTQTANDLQGFTDFNAPIVNQRQASTTVSVQDGHTVILGGIMRSTVTSKVKKLPILGDIPILGELFKSTERQNQKTELLVFLTPRIVRSTEEADQLNKDQTERMSKASQDAIKGNLKKSADSGAVKTGPKKKGN